MSSDSYVVHYSYIWNSIVISSLPRLLAIFINKIENEHLISYRMDLSIFTSRYSRTWSFIHGRSIVLSFPIIHSFFNTFSIALVLAGWLLCLERCSICVIVALSFRPLSINMSNKDWSFVWLPSQGTKLSHFHALFWYIDANHLRAFPRQNDDCVKILV